MERRRFMDRWPQIRIDGSDDENQNDRKRERERESRIGGDVWGNGGIKSSDSLLSRCYVWIMYIILLFTVEIYVVRRKFATPANSYSRPITGPRIHLREE